MSRVRFRIAISLDGFVAGPSQSVEEPLGVGGERLHDWFVPLRTFQRLHGRAGGVVNDSDAVVESAFENIGATIMGRNMFGGHPGPWPTAPSWDGWWGKNPPFHHPVFVLTHHAREPLECEGGTTFHFVTEGIDAALERARDAAAGKDVSLAGGAHAAQQYLSRGLVDDMLLHLVPILLGGGERLFDDVGTDLFGLQLTRTVPADDVVHLFFARH